MAVSKSSGRPKSGYKAKDGVRVPGVTTILGRFKESGALLLWAYEQGKRGERGEIDHLYDARDKAADAGTLAHDMIEAAICGEDAMAVCAAHADPTIQLKAQRAYAQYQDWQKQSKIEIIATEMPLVSERYQFAGTPDAIGKLPDGTLVLLDWKTSGGIYVDYLLQLAAYRILVHEATDYRLTGGSHLLRFSKESADFHHHHWADLEDAEQMFLHLLEAYKLDKVLRKRV